MGLKIYNTLTKQHEAFVPNHPNQVTFYSCGPTVYDDAHIGNFRSFLAADLLRRWIESPLCTLENDSDSANICERTVVQVMNITDVGHMTDDDIADGAGQDKMELASQRLLQAKKSGKLPPDAGVEPSDPFAIARYYEQRFREDAIELGLKVAIDAQTDQSLMPRATDNIEQMKQVIEQLLNDNYAYPAGQPGSRAIYFDVQRFKAYGQLSGNSIDQLKGGAGGRTDESNTQEKHHPADFLLWKEDATHKMKWPSPKVPNQADWGEGYPGWHIECTAMALRGLVDNDLSPDKIKGATIDIHSGGEDNIFPHHECEIAQSCCFTGADHFANYWFHPRFLKVEGQKMSKSKGTMYTLRDLKEKGFDPAAIRLELIKTHYRANADFSMQGLKDSAKQIAFWRDYARLLLSEHSIRPDHSISTLLHEHLYDITQAMSNDLNIASAIAWLNISINNTGVAPETSILHLTTEERDQRESTAKKIHASSAKGKSIPDRVIPSQDAILVVRDESRSFAERSYAALHVIDNILGVIFRPIEKSQDTGIALYQPGVTPSPEIEQLLTQRRDAKKSKDFATADAIRDQLTAMGLAIMDKPEGKVEVAPIN